MPDPIYAVGDIHGQLAEFERAMALIDADDQGAAPVVFLGDYADRGPDTCGVIERLSAGQAAGRNWITLQGNHDHMFLAFLEEGPVTEPGIGEGAHWLLEPSMGSAPTLESYGVTLEDGMRLHDVHAQARDKIPQSHLAFLRELRPFYHMDDLFFVHAGIRPGVPLDAQDPDDLIWIRNTFLNDPNPHPALIVHGHTPVAQATHYGNRVNLDSGAGYGAQISVAVFEDRKVWELTGAGRRPLTPIPDAKSTL